jgi:hypothetical protein
MAATQLPLSTKSTSEAATSQQLYRLQSLVVSGTLTGRLPTSILPNLCRRHAGSRRSGLKYARISVDMIFHSLPNLQTTASVFVFVISTVLVAFDPCAFPLLLPRVSILASLDEILPKQRGHFRSGE